MSYCVDATCWEYAEMNARTCYVHSNKAQEFLPRVHGFRPSIDKGTDLCVGYETAPSLRFGKDRFCMKKRLVPGKRSKGRVRLDSAARGIKHIDGPTDEPRGSRNATKRRQPQLETNGSLVSALNSEQIAAYNAFFFIENEDNNDVSEEEEADCPSIDCRIGMAVMVEFNGVVQKMDLNDTILKLYDAYGFSSARRIALSAASLDRQSVRETGLTEETKRTRLCDFGFQAGDTVYIVEAVNGAK